MKIGFDAKRAFLNASGLGNYSRNTLNALQKYFPENYYTLFTPEIKKDLFENYEQFEIVSPNSPFSKLVKSLWRSFSLSRRLQKHELDLFHGLSNELPEGTGKTKMPSVVTIHDLIFMRFPKFYKPLDRKIYFQKTKYACTVATKIIAISQQTKNDIVTFLNADPEKIEVIYQSVSPLFFEKLNTEYLETKYNLPETFILSVGTIEHRKNQLTLLKAVRNAKIETPIVFVGRPTLYSAGLLKFISENNLEEQVTFLNNIPEKDLVALYQKASLSVYISLFEGFGLPVIEAMACGCPVLTSNVSCLPETAGDAATLCNPTDENEMGKKIKMLLEDTSLRHSFIEKGKKRAHLFHPEKYAQNLVSLYAKILP
ncbi:MAG: glycosyltransferase family 4 protein [Prolixibacteraceae bacterium]|nr:glycosyltransferase family 4 protein [Prolixibacteraceae bacterium]